MYHHVAPFVGREHLLPYVVSPRVFSAQLDAIVSLGFQIVTLSDLIQRVQSLQTTARCVVLTFDDCAKDLWDFAIPELERRGLKASFFAVSSRFGGENDWDDHRGGARVPLMCAEELKDLASMGHEVGSHGASHVRLDQCQESVVRDELIRSRQEISDVTGAAVQTLAYPFGAVPKLHDSLCRSAGYLAACSIFSTAPTVLDDRFSMRRILVHEADVGWRLRFKLSGVYLQLRKFRDPMLISRENKRRAMSQ